MNILIHYMDSEPRVKLKTYTYYIKNNKQKLIFDEMTKYSKNIYNTSIFHYNIYKYFENDIYRDLFYYIYENKLMDDIKSPKIINKKDKKKDKKEKKKTSEKLNRIQLELYKIYYKYRDFYVENYNQHKENNSTIYSSIKDLLKDTFVINSNYFWLRNIIINELNNTIKYNEQNKKFVFYDIIDKILRSHYNHNYYHVKNSILHKKPLKLLDKSFIEDVLNDRYLFPNMNDYYKNHIYEELNIQLLSENNIIGRIVYRDIENEKNPNHKKLPADVIGNIIDKAYTNIKSYYGLKENGLKCNLPKFLPKNSKFNLFYYCRSFKCMDNKIRLTVGDNIVKNYEKIQKDTNIKKIKDRLCCYVNNESIKFDPYYTYIKYPKKIREKQIKLIEIKPVHDNYKICITYESGKTIPLKKEEIMKYDINKKLKESISIDLGMVNLMAIYNPTGKQHLIKGGTIISLNEFYVKKITEIQSSKIKEEKKIQLISGLYKDREKRMVAYINELINIINKMYKNKSIIIVGYNEQWKQNSKLNGDINRKFQQIPYKRILKKLRSSWEDQGKILIEVEESYTSKCDALKLEPLKKKDYLGERIRRGLYISGNGKAINADINGAINIMRKIYKEINEIKGERIYNPEKINWRVLQCQDSQ